MERLDMEKWPRREIYSYFSSISQPFYSVSFTLDVTQLHAFAKREGLSFYYALVFLVTRAVNQTPAFLVDVADGEPMRLHRREPSFTDMKKGTENFYIVTMPAGDDIRTFCASAKARSTAQYCFLDQEGESQPLIYISCLPWIELTGFTNERDFDPDDSVPRITWGKYVSSGGRLKLGMSLEVNHRFVDGTHIGQFAQRLEAEIGELC